MSEESKYPALERILSDFLYEEEANISRKKVVAIGTMLALATILLTTEAFAKHSSHSSHGSHGSHGSHSSHGSGDYHRSHVSHTSHTSHTSSTGHASHSSSIDHASHASTSYSEHASHASHGSAAVNHASHASVGASHVNSGISDVLPDNSVDVPETGLLPDVELPEDVIDIRVPLIPPDSPSMSELD